MKLRSRILVVLSVALFVLFGSGSCSSATSNGPIANEGGVGEAGDGADGGDGSLNDGGSRSECSTGEPYKDALGFKVDESKFVPGPTCIPRCAYGRGQRAGVYFLDALPRGACSVDGEACAMGIQIECPCLDQGPVHMFRCDCVAGNWSCLITAQGSAFCACAADAATD